MKPVKIHSKHWIVDEDDNMIMGAGRKEILETIDRTGSINQTAKIMKMSYKGVWGRIKATEKALKITIVHTDRKTGSCLTEEGKKLLKKYTQLKKECLKADDQIFKNVFDTTSPPIVSIVGKSGSGKTTFLEKLIRVFNQQGYRTGTIKHHLHDFEMDCQGKDSWRHKQAGSEISMIASPHKVGMVMDVDHDPSFDELIPYFSGMDIVFSEGHKKGSSPKIEVFRKGVHQEPVCADDKTLIALVTDTDLDLGVPRFSLDDAEGVKQFLIGYFKINQK